MAAAPANHPGVQHGSRAASAAAAAAVQPIPYPGRYVVVKQFAIDPPDAHPLPDTAPLHYNNPYYLRLDLKTHSTRLLHNSIQQTSVDATPEHHVAVVSGLVAAGVLPDDTLSPSPSSLQLLPNQRSCSIASAGKKVAFADTVLVCNVDDGDDDDDDDDDHDDDNDDQISAYGRDGTSFPPSLPEPPGPSELPVNPTPPAPPAPPVPPAPQRSLFNVLQVYSQTGELVGDLLIERQREPWPPSAPSTPSPVNDPVATPSPVDDAGRRKRHEMFCRRRQSPVYSCDDGETASATAATAVAAAVLSSPDDKLHSPSSSSVYESCEELSVVVLNTVVDQPPMPIRHHSHHRPAAAAAIRGYAGCCPL